MLCRGKLPSLLPLRIPRMPAPLIISVLPCCGHVCFFCHWSATELLATPLVHPQRLLAGNCFFRAFIFAYLESLLLSGDQEECKRWVERGGEGEERGLPGSAVRAFVLVAEPVMWATRQATLRAHSSHWPPHTCDTRLGWLTCRWHEPTSMIPIPAFTLLSMQVVRGDPGVAQQNGGGRVPGGWLDGQGGAQPPATG